MTSASWRQTPPARYSPSERPRRPANDRCAALDLGRTPGPPVARRHWRPSIKLSGEEAWRATRNAQGVAAVHYRRRDDAVEVQAWGPGAELALEHAPGVLGQADDRDGFAPSHPLLRDLARRFAGLRLTRTSAVLEALVPSVFEQKVIGLEARRGYSRMLRALGEPVPGPLPMLAPSADVLRRTPTGPTTGSPWSSAARSPWCAPPAAQPGSRTCRRSLPTPRGRS